MAKSNSGTTGTPESRAAGNGAGDQSVLEATEARATASLMSLLGDQEQEPGADEAAAPDGEAEEQTETQSERQESQANNGQGSEEGSGSDDADETPGDEDDEDGEESPAEEESEDGEESGDEDGDEDETEELTPKAQHAFNKRVAKEVARRKAAEERAQAAEARLKELETTVTPVNGHTADQELARQDPAVKALLKEQSTAQAVRANARAFLRELSAEEDQSGATGHDRVVAKLKERKIQLDRWDAPSVREWLEDQADAAGQRIIDANQQLAVKRERLTERARNEGAQMEAKALASYPWLSDESLDAPETPEAREAAKLWKAGAFRNLPGGRLLLGDLVAGKLARERKAGTATPPARKAPKVGGAPAASPATHKVNGKVSKMRKAIATGTDLDIEEALMTTIE